MVRHCYLTQSSLCQATVTFSLWILSWGFLDNFEEFLKESMHKYS